MTPGRHGATLAFGLRVGGGDGDRAGRRASGVRGGLRVSHADREQVIDTLKAAFGALADEFRG